MRRWIVLLALGGLAAPALAGDDEDPPVEASLHGDVKTFTVASFPYPWLQAPAELEPLLSPEQLDALTAPLEDPSLQGVASGRLKLDAAWGPLTLEAHHIVVAQGTGSSPLQLASSRTGVGVLAPEAVDLTWEAETGDAMQLYGRTDRLSLGLHVPHLDVTVGRQPISFGTGFFFTPLDLVNPFFPTTIDQEYKPGVDAVRVDVFGGLGTQLTLVSAYAGSWDLDGTVHAVAGRTTVGVTDLLGFAGWVHGEGVVGAGFASSVGPVGVHGEATLTASGDEPFVRAVLGADGRPTGTTTVMGEVYAQTFGASAPDGYLDVLSSDRVARGEVWLAGRWYGALSVAQEITPLVTGNLALIANLADPSALLAPGLTWSVANEVTVGAGAYVGMGARPDEVPLLFVPTSPELVAPPSPDDLASSVNSEFGLYPAAAFLQVSAYF